MMDSLLRKAVLSIGVLALLMTAVPTAALANSAAPPSLVIVVDNPPSDLRIEPIDGGTMDKFIIRQWQGYCAFYHLSYSDDIDFRVTASGLDFNFTLRWAIDEQLSSSSEGGHWSYHSYYHLDLQTHECVPDDEPLRPVPATVLRVFLTLVIEGAVLWLLGFRRRLSWLSFLIVNLITQTALNLTLANWLTPFTFYPIFYLLTLELGVFMFELITLVPLLAIFESRGKATEGQKLSGRSARELVGDAAGFVLVANIASLILGGLLLMSLPI
jgi:hypothetical protein